MPRPRTEPPLHDHIEQDRLCHPYCPAWRWEDYQTRLGVYCARRDIEAMLSATLAHDSESLATLRHLQQEHPNRWPRR